MSPILVRPVREQLEHERVIRLLQAKYKKKFEVAINPGHEQTTPVGSGSSPWCPDLVLRSNSGRKLLGVVEVETIESVTHLEAMSEWATFSRLRVPFHLYVPASSIDTTKRLCADLQISVTEIWAFHTLDDQIRFTLAQRMPHAAVSSARRTPARRATARARRVSAARPARHGTAASGARRTATAKKSKAARGVARKKASRSSRTQKRK